MHHSISGYEELQAVFDAQGYLDDTPKSPAGAQPVKHAAKCLYPVCAVLTKPLKRCIILILFIPVYFKFSAPDLHSGMHVGHSGRQDFAALLSQGSETCTGFRTASDGGFST